MKWFLYFNYGSCNDGDHDNGLETFDTQRAAGERVKELLDLDDDCQWKILSGWVVGESK